MREIHLLVDKILLKEFLENTWYVGIFRITILFSLAYVILLTVPRYYLLQHQHIQIYKIWYSEMVTHLSIDKTRHCLTPVIIQEHVFERDVAVSLSSQRRVVKYQMNHLFLAIYTHNKLCTSIR